MPKSPYDDICFLLVSHVTDSKQEAHSTKVNKTPSLAGGNMLTKVGNFGFWIKYSRE